MRTVFAALVLMASSAQADVVCKTNTLQDVHAIEDPSSVVRKGEGLGNVTMYSRSPTGDAFCEHGGYCYPAHVRGKRAQILLNCHIDFKHPTKVADETLYDLLPGRRR